MFAHTHPFKKSALALTLVAAAVAPNLHAHSKDLAFKRIASFPAFSNTSISQDSVAEIVTTTTDGSMLIYTDSANDAIGFVDISNPAAPSATGLLAVGGEPTSVGVAGDYALAAVNTSPNFVAPSGVLKVIDIATQTIVATLDLGGQPDSVAISPDGNYAAIAIENERDEDLGDGEPPQAPGGYLVIVDLIGAPATWTTRTVNFDGVADLFPNDAEVEYVDINKNNIAVVTLQENNHLVLVDLPTGNIINDFSAGTVDLDQIDTNENDLIELNSSLSDVPREPDGVKWISEDLFVTADEGDLYGGSRGFTIFDTSGNVKYASGNDIEHLVARIGHYPEDRSENKGSEPENVTYGKYGKNEYLFVGSERSSVITVYELNKHGKPKFKQVLPSGMGPEGLVAIPQRGLFVSASEEDSRSDGFRSVLSIYQLQEDGNQYPQIESRNRPDGTPIPWAALSGLAADNKRPNKVAYTIHDSFYQKSRIYKMRIDKQPAKITKEIILNDAMGKLSAVNPSMVNGDGTVNLDMEGIATRKDGGFWIASEGAGTIGDPSRPVTSLDLLLKVKRNGLIEQVVTLPASTNARQVRFGYEGVASVGAGNQEVVFVAFQREWTDDPKGKVRIGRYETATGDWTFYYYPIEAVASANGGWVGLSDLAAIGDDEFAVIERDNQAGPDAAIKRIYKFSVAGLTPTADPAPGVTPTFPTLGKTLVKDLMNDLQASGGLVPEKIEGLMILPNGDAYINNDNDGVDDNNGETQMIKLNKLF